MKAQQYQTDNHLGLSLEHEDGDVAVMVEPSVVCPEANCRKYVKSLGSEKLTSQSSLIDKERRTENNVRNEQEMIQSSTNGEPSVGNDGQPNRNDESDVSIEEMKRRREYMWKALGKKQGVKIATLNVHGKTNEKGISKYKDITTMLRKNKIYVLGIQETRLNDAEVQKLLNENPMIHIESNGNSTAKEGVAFVLNKNLLANKTWIHTTIIENRVSRLQLQLEENEGLDIILIYAPNETNAKLEFFEKLKQELNKIKDLSDPILMGDFNCVEDSIDRYPMREDDERLSIKIDELKKKYKWVDGWRIHNPTEKKYTFHQESTKSKSRIDRIYTTKELYKYAYNWEIETTGNISDHDMVYVEILKKQLPYVGEGLWRINEETTKYEPFRKKARIMLMKAQNEMQKCKQQQNQKTNPQKIWKNLKTELKTLAITESKKRKAQLNQKKKHLRKEIHQLINMNNIVEQEEEKRNEKIQKLRKELKEQQSLEYKKLRQTAQARYEEYGEKNTKYWFNLNKFRPKEPPILALHNVNDEIKNTTREMTEIASNYHKNLQKRPEWNNEREIAIQKMLDSIDSRINEEQIKMLEEKTTIEEIDRALIQSNNGKTPGVDGWNYEFWKSWPRPEKDTRESETIPDIIYMLHMLINDIEINGIKEQDFTKGVMFLLYKKKDKKRIENYRPLTLLNTDYKIYTKTIATKLGKIAPTLLHENQAGFVPGRGLWNHTRTSHLIIEYCDLIGYNGCIVALDQEKAYDKIDHDYMWRVLEKNGLPNKFIERVKELYKCTETIIMVNGVLPKPIKVERGVRQGDPMSCLLYNFSIEPLAILLRKSELKGIEVPGLREKILVTLFADDTLVYMGKDDSMKVLDKIIEEFCKASTAKFNIEKTEYLPIGTKEYREEVIRTRKIGTKEIAENISLIQDGSAMRTLGAWIGNNGCTEVQWNKILNKQKEIMELWGKTRPTMKGKELILKALVMSRATFLATVNNIPKNIEKRMQKQMKDFVWNGKEKGLMTWNEIISNREEGGLGIPDLRTRIEAIQVMWVKKWLVQEEKRPAWAYIIDEILRKNIAKTPMIDQESRENWIMQTWHESMAKDSKISPMIREMLKIARKYNVRVEPQKLAIKVKEEMPIWHHIGVTNNYIWNKKASRCLRTTHKIKTVGDIVNYMNNSLHIEICDQPEKCRRITSDLISEIPNKFNPVFETPKKDKLDHTPRRKRLYKTKNVMKDTVVFNPDITERESIYNTIRIFGEEKTYKRRNETMKTKQPAYRLNIIPEQERQKIIIYTDGSADKNGDENAIAGAGIWYGDENIENESIRLPKGQQSSQRAELVAILKTIQNNTKDDLEIKSDSKTSLEGIVSRISEWEDKNWLDVKNEQEWKTIAFQLRKRNGITGFRWVKAHDKEHGNEEADKLAKLATKKLEQDFINYEIDDNFKVDGARLNTLTQAQAYKLILKLRKEKPGKGSITNTTKNNIEDIQNEIERTTGTKPTEENIWKNLKAPIKSKINDFIWRTIHGRNKCGKFFRNIPSMEHLQWCECGEIETIEHILLHCERFKVEEMWKEIEQIWNKSAKTKWIQPSIGIILGIGTIQIKEKKKVDAAETKRYRIMISEAAWTIWKDRCKRRIEGEVTPIEQTIKNWKIELNKRIENEFNIIKDKEKLTRNLHYQKLKEVWFQTNVFGKLTEKNQAIELELTKA
jgi:ribonuclease HI/exonuclease III